MASIPLYPNILSTLVCFKKIHKLLSETNLITLGILEETASFLPAAVCYKNSLLKFLFLLRYLSVKEISMDMIHDEIIDIN